jgi:DDE_Tnp_1-associated
MSLIEHLHTIRDFRTQPNYPLWVVLLLVVMGTMSGCTGYRPLADFVSRHQAELLSVLELPQHRLPSLSTLRRIMVRVDFESFTRAFNAWAQEHFAPASQEHLATDGKSIKASVSDYDQPYQDFVSVVSAFSVTQGVVVGLETMRNHQTSEIKTVEVLLETLKLKGVCFSLDALHTQKNTQADYPQWQ